MTDLPGGFAAYVTQIGIKDGVNEDDFVIIAARRPVAAAGVFTRSRFAGPSVSLSRSHLSTRTAQAMVVISKNANVANGEAGVADAHEIVDRVADRLGCEDTDVLIASTGVIGRRYPIERIRASLDHLPETFDDHEIDRAAAGITTTDTFPKISSAKIGETDARVVGCAKGVGMLEPDMATMIAIITTDAAVEPKILNAIFRRVVDRTFNCISVDTDTSTSDTAIILASGAAGDVDLGDFEHAIDQVCTDLSRMIAADGEGAQTLIEVVVDEAADADQAKRVAKAIVNSPLVKTAVHGADPNWGRVAMAVGKCSDDTDICPDQVVIRFGTTEVYPQRLDDSQLATLSTYMSGDEVLIHVSLHTGAARARVWGCDLTADYVRINADYTT